MDNESSTNPFTNGASEEVSCQKGSHLHDHGTDNDGNTLKQNGKKTPELIFLGRPSNGKVTDDDDDDDDDLGPETDVDAVDDIQNSPSSNPFDTEAELQQQLLDFDPIKEPRQDTPTPPADEVTGGSGLVPDNVAESGEESEDEWNYYRVEPTGKPADRDTEQQTSDTVCEKPAEEVVSEDSGDSSENMESQLNPNAAEFIPSPTQHRSLEQFLHLETALNVDASLSPLLPPKIEEGAPTVPFDSDNLNTSSPSETLPDLLNGQNTELPQTEDSRFELGGTSVAVIKEVDVDLIGKLSKEPDVLDVNKADITNPVMDVVLEESSQLNEPANLPTAFQDMPVEAVSEFTSHSQFDEKFIPDDIPTEHISPQRSGDTLSVDNVEGSSGFTPAIRESNLEELHAEEESDMLTVELDVLCSPNKHSVAETDTSHAEISLSAHQSDSSETEFNKLVETSVTQDFAEFINVSSSFTPGDKLLEPVHISFELQKDIAPEMESQPELVKLNGENSLSFDVQELVIEEANQEIDENSEAYFENEFLKHEPTELNEHLVPIEMGNNLVSVNDPSFSQHIDAPESKIDLICASPESKIDFICTTPESKEVSSLECPMTLSDHKDLSSEEVIFVEHEDVSGSDLAAGIVPEANLSVGLVTETDLPIEVVSESDLSVGLSLEENVINEAVVDNTHITEIEPPNLTLAPPQTQSVVPTIHDSKPEVQSVVEVLEKLPEVMTVTAAATVATAVAAGADVTGKKDESVNEEVFKTEDAETNKEPVVPSKKPSNVKPKKPLPEKTKGPIKSGPAASSKPVPSKTVKSVPTSPTKPVMAVPKTAPKKSPASAQFTRPPKPPAQTATAGVMNRPKSNGIASKPSPTLSKSKLLPGSSPSGTTSNDASKTIAKRPEPTANKTGSGTSLPTKTRPFSAPVSISKALKPALPKTSSTITTTRPSTVDTNGSVSKPRVSLSRPKTVSQSKVASVKEGKESVNKQISSSRITNTKPLTSTANRSVTQSITRKVETRSIGSSVSITKTTTSTLKTSMSKLGSKKSSVTSSSSPKTKVSTSENLESVKEVNSSVISNEVKCEQPLFENADVAE